MRVEKDHTVQLGVDIVKWLAVGCPIPSCVCCKLRLKHRPDIGEVRDVPALGIVVITRFIRVMVLWIVVFFVA